MKILDLKEVQVISKTAQKEINGGYGRNCIDRVCMRACIQAGGRSIDCYYECMIC